MVFQVLRFPTKGICEEKALYYHRGRDERGAEILDLDGFFNLFYIEKYLFFTDISSLRLRLKTSGYLKAILMHDREAVCEKKIENDEISFDCPLEQDKKGVYWVRLIKDESIYEKERTISGAFEGDLMEAPRPTQIGVAICTFKREAYVLRNLKSMLDYFEENKDLASCYHIFLVDNGKTLASRDDFKALMERAKKLEGEVPSNPCLLRLIENANTGGTGGFTRGMKEAIKEKENLGLTRLLLFDDDAVFDPEIFLRLHSLIVSLKEKYRDITIGGAMWREDMPYILHAMGERHKNFKVSKPMLLADLRKFETCTCAEMTKPDPFSGLYSGWWCCCYSMDIITEKNLPMPLFIHMDDIMFCRLHADKGMLLMPGIGVWHQGFELRFPGVTGYYNTRNELITTAVLDEMSVPKLTREITKKLSGPLLSFRYAEMDLAYRGVMDFLKGPQWLDEVDSEKLNTQLMQYYNQRVKFKPLKELLDEKTYKKLAENKFTDEAKKQAIFDHWMRRANQGSYKKFITLNGWILPPLKKMGLFSNADSPWNLYRRKKVLIYEPVAERGYIEKRRPLQMIKCAFMAMHVSGLLLTKYKKTAKLYKKRAGL